MRTIWDDSLAIPGLPTPDRTPGGSITHAAAIWACLGLGLLSFGAAPALADRDADAAQAFQESRWEAAAEGYAEVVEQEPENADAWFRLGYALHALGQLEDALVAHEHAATLPHAAQSTAAYNAACACARLERADDAITWLERAVKAGFASDTMLDQDADFAALRDTPAFLAIRERLVTTGRFRSLLPAEPGNAHQFDFWLGDWESQNYAPDGNGGWNPAGRLQTRVFEVADGNAILEYSADPRIASAGGSGGMQGFSMRTYDAVRDEWTLVLNWPSRDQPRFYALTGRMHHRRGEFVSARNPIAGGESQTRFSFSDITRDRYRWDNATTADGGKSWSTTLVFEATRRDAAASPLDFGPAKTNDHASGAEFRSFDFLLGDWVGTRSRRAQDGSWIAEPMTRTSYAILEGAAVVDDVFIGSATGTGAGAEPSAGAYRAFNVRCFEPSRSAWVQYRVDNRASRFDRFQGPATAAGEELVLAGAAGPGSAGVRGALVWTERGPDVVRCEFRDGAEVVWKQELRRKP